LQQIAQLGNTDKVYQEHTALLVVGAIFNRDSPYPVAVKIAPNSFWRLGGNP
jgi:hypothetical protein